MGAEIAEELMGWWIKPDGTYKSIPDHFEHVRAHPVEFGATRAAAAKWTLADRASVIESALRKGWVRVRGTRPNLSMEFQALDGNTIANIRGFLTSQRIDPDEKIMFEANTQNWYEPASWILEERALAAAANPRRKRS
jgi:hypothetical protein